MALYRQIDFNTGTVTDKFGAIPTVTGAILSQKEKGFALETSSGKYIQYDRQLLPNNAFSVVVWAKLRISSSASSISAIISTEHTGGGAPSLSLERLSLGRAMFFMGSTNYRIYDWGGDKNWHCFIFIVPGASQTDINNSKFYVDTTLKTAALTDASDTQASRSGLVYLGGANNINGGCFISKLKVYDTVLTQKQIEAEQREFELTKPISIPKRGFQINKSTELKQSGLVAAYNMKPIGNTLVDISGNGNNITISKLVNSTNGMKYNQNILSSNTTPSVPISNFTASYRLNTGNAVSTHLFSLIASSNFYISFNNTSIIIYDSAVWYTIVNGLVLNNKSCTFTFTLNAITKLLTVYLNGISVGTYTLKGNVPTNIATLLGNYNVGTLQVDSEYVNIKIYNRILSTSEIKAYHNSFIKQPYILEDFRDASADGTTVVPNGWTKGTGSYKVGEFVKTSGLIYNPLNFTNIWSAVNVTINNANTFTNTSAVGIIRRNDIITPGHRYKLTIVGSTTSTGVSIMDFATNALIKNLNTNLNQSFIFTATYSGLAIVSNVSSSVTTISSFQLVELDPLPTFKNRTKYLECTTAGTIALPSDQAYGTWEFDWYKGADSNWTQVNIINDRFSAITDSSIGYYFLSHSTEQLYAGKTSIGTHSNPFYTANSYIQNFTWYRIKITRTQSGVFTTYIKGGTFGNNWTLVSVSGGAGTNPFTDNTYTTSNFFVISANVGDRFTNLIMKKGIEI